MADIVAIDYEAASRIAKEAEQLSKNAAQIRSNIDKPFLKLKEGAWESDAADVFLDEYERKVSPGLVRLTEGLQATSHTLNAVIEIFQRAEQEAAARFNGGMESGFGGGNGVGRNVPIANFRDPNFDQDRFIREINPNGRPVQVVVHGFNVSEADYRDQIARMRADNDKKYGHLPLNQRPMVIGVSWDGKKLPDAAGFGRSALEGALVGAGVGMRGGVQGAAAGAVFGAIANPVSDARDVYHAAQASALSAGGRFGNFLDKFQQYHPETPINVIAHSAGNVVVMEGMRNSDARLNSYFAVQPAVDRHELLSGGRYTSVLDPERVGRFGVTSRNNDQALWGHYVIGNAPGSGFEPALGNDAGQVRSPNLIHYDLDKSRGADDSPYGLNHHNFNDPALADEMRDFYSERGNFNVPQVGRGTGNNG